MKFWQDLRRRHVYRLIGLYIVGAWLVIQVAATFFPAWGIPETALRYLIIAALLCFPVAVVFSWFYDITSTGIVRTARAGDTSAVDFRLKRADYLILAALVSVLVVVFYGSVEKVRESTDSVPTAIEAAPNSIAVLPFSNYDDDPNTKYFSDGVTEEILHRLSEFADLKVMARNSSFTFADSNMTIPRISELLGVRYLLQGSVRRDIHQVRITAQLVDSSGRQVWSQTFDRKLEGIFAIQTEIANSVAKQLVDRVAPRSVDTARTTTNMDAYQEYLIGREYLYRRSSGWASNAFAAFRRAIELDPGYAPPYAGLAVATYLAPLEKSESIRESNQVILDRAIAYAESALDLDPNLAEAHAARGLFYMDGPAPDPIAAEISLRRALALDPSVVNAYNWLSKALLAQNRADEGNVVQQKSLEIDPLNPLTITRIASHYRDLGDFSQAEILLRRMLEFPSPPEFAYVALFDLYAEFGRLPDAVHALAEWKAASPASMDPEFFYKLADSCLILGLREDADDWNRRGVDIDFAPTRILLRNARMLKSGGRFDELRAHMENIDLNSPIDIEMIPISGLETLATVRIFAGQYAAGISLLSFDDLQSHVGNLPLDTVDLLHILAFAYRATGNTRQAEDILEIAAASVEAQLEKGVSKSPEWLEQQALNLTMQGNLNDAAATLALAVDAGWRNYRLLAHDPRWQPLFSLAKLEPLLIAVESDLDRQAREVNSILADLNL
jgi:TolB-like protein